MTQPIRTEIPGLFVLPLPTPFPIGRVNAYLAQGEALTLIDTGVNSPQSYDALRAGLAALGATPADLDRIIVTHHHTDHIGLVDRLAEESGAAVWCHSRCVPYVERPAETRHRLQVWSRDVWREGGAPQALLDLTQQLFDWFATLSNGPFPVSRAVEDGETIDLLGQTWVVYHTPGHAGDLVCFFEPERRVLLASDHVLRDVSSNPLIEPPEPGQKRPRRLVEYMAQLQRVADLAPRIAYTGHGEPVTDVPGLVARRLAFHRERAACVLALLKDGPCSLYELTEKMFPHIAGPEKFLALSEVLGHLDWLEQEGQIDRMTEGGLTRWRAA